MNVQAWMREAEPKRTRRRKVLRPISVTVAFETALRTITLRILRAAAERVAKDVLPATISAKAQMMRDDLNWFERAMRALRDLLDGLIDGAREGIKQAFETENQRHSRRFNEAMRSAIGMDLGRVIVGEGITNTIEAAVQRNVALIRGMTGDVAKRLFAYQVSGKQVLRQWFSYRRRDRTRPIIGDRRPPSPLDAIQPEHWQPEYTTDLMNLLHVLGRLVRLEPAQAALLQEVLDNPLIAVERLRRKADDEVDSARQTEPA